MDEIKKMVNGRVYFDTPIKVKATPHTPLIVIHGVEKTPAGDVYVQLADEIKPLNKDEKMLVVSVYQRLKLIEFQKQCTNQQT